MKLFYVLDIPKTLLFNFYYLPFRDAIKFPFHVAYDTKIKSLGRRDSVLLHDPAKRIVIGHGESFALGNKTYWEVSKAGRIEFAGAAVIGKGTQVIAGGVLQLGDNFYCNANCIINASRNIIIGDGFLMGWNCTIIDGDGHSIAHDGIAMERNKPIYIGDHVWCAANVSILKGSSLPDETVVAFGGTITRKHEGTHKLIGGMNKVLSDNVTWTK